MTLILNHSTLKLFIIIFGIQFLFIYYFDNSRKAMKRLQGVYLYICKRSNQYSKEKENYFLFLAKRYYILKHTYLWHLHLSVSSTRHLSTGRKNKGILENIHIFQRGHK